MLKSLLQKTQTNKNEKYKQTKTHHMYDNRQKVFKGTVTNQALSYLHGGSLEITLTVPLNRLREK